MIARENTNIPKSCKFKHGSSAVVTSGSAPAYKSVRSPALGDGEAPFSKWAAMSYNWNHTNRDSKFQNINLSFAVGLGKMDNQSTYTHLREVPLCGLDSV